MVSAKIVKMQLNRIKKECDFALLYEDMKGQFPISELKSYEHFLSYLKNPNYYILKWEDYGYILILDVFDYICESQTTKRAYTTVKTVMDRLHEKEVLLRIKQGKKFYYRTAYSNNDIIANSLKKIAIQYCNGDMNKLIQVASSINSNELSVVETKVNAG